MKLRAAGHETVSLRGAWCRRDPILASWWVGVVFLQVHQSQPLPQIATLLKKQEPALGQRVPSLGRRLCVCCNWAGLCAENECHVALSIFKTMPIADGLKPFPMRSRVPPARCSNVEGGRQEGRG